VRFGDAHTAARMTQDQTPAQAAAIIEYIGKGE
jgi:hypothetical protein